MRDTPEMREMSVSEQRYLAVLAVIRASNDTTQPKPDRGTAPVSTVVALIPFGLSTVFFDREERWRRRISGRHVR